MVQATATELIQRARAWHAADGRQATDSAAPPGPGREAWCDGMAERIGALADRFMRAELPLTLQQAVVQVAAVGWNLSRCPPEHRAGFLEALSPSEEVLPMLLGFAEEAGRRWPTDPRFIVAAELSVHPDGLAVSCAAVP